MKNNDCDVMNDIIRLQQEEEYLFPYHYVTQFKNNNFEHFYLDAWSINYGSTIEYLLQKIAVCPGARIVDIGCGDGRFSRELSLACQSNTVVGIDYSVRAVALASAMNTGIANLKFQALDITKIHNLEPFDDAVLMEVFEHIPQDDAEDFMRSVRALLKKGGCLYLTVPHENKPVEYKHFQHFSVAKISDYLRPYFDLIEVVPFEKVSWRRGLISKVLNNRFFILRSPFMLSAIYKWYKKHLFHCVSEKDCQRIFVKAAAR